MSAAAKYQEVAGALREGIRAGEWETGDQLPTEQSLIDSYGASRSTIRQAIQELRNEGLVTVQHGVGVFVAAPRVVQRLDARERLSKARRDENRSAFLAEASAQQFTPSSSVKVTFEAAGAYAELLGIEEAEEVCVRDRVMRADGQPVQLATSRLPRRITRGTDLEKVDTGAGGTHARLEDLGHPPTFHEEIDSAKLADRHEREMFGSDVGALLTIKRTTWSGDRIVEINHMTMPGSMYESRHGWDAD